MRPTHAGKSLRRTKHSLRVHRATVLGMGMAYHCGATERALCATHVRLEMTMAGRDLQVRGLHLVVGGLFASGDAGATDWV